MRRYPFTVPGLVRLTSGGGPSVVERLRSGMEPLVMALIHRFDASERVCAVSSDELQTLCEPEFPLLLPLAVSLYSPCMVVPVIVSSAALPLPPGILQVAPEVSSDSV